jgi:hypothetical protein
VRLDVVVAPDCRGCDEARAVASEIQERFPDLRVNLVVLDGRRPPPERVVATPTYLLDGTVVSLGNPRLADLVRAIERHAVAPPDQPHRPARRRWRLPWHRRTAELG